MRRYAAHPRRFFLHYRCRSTFPQSHPQVAQPTCITKRTSSWPPYAYSKITAKSLCGRFGSKVCTHCTLYTLRLKSLRHACSRLLDSTATKTGGGHTPHRMAALSCKMKQSEVTPLQSWPHPEKGSLGTSLQPGLPRSTAAGHPD